MSSKLDKVDILVVDDRSDGLIALTAVLNNPRYNVVTALSGREAIAHLSHHNFAVILMDVQMPELDGFETAELIKENTDYRSIPIIFVTAISKEEKYLFKGYQLGAVDYVFKPFDPYILKSKVAVFVDLFEQKQQVIRQSSLLREVEQRERFRHLAELELESLRRYRNLADAIPHVVCKAKGDGTLDYFNQVWTDYTGLTLEQSIGNGWQSALYPDDVSGVLKAWLQGMIDGSPFEAEARIQTTESSPYKGALRWNLMRGVPEKRPSGDVIAWLGTCTDIHDRKENEVALQNAKEAAEQANNAKTNFLANMSHEIRTPLSAILGFTELLAQSTSTEERAQSLATIRRNGEQLILLIDEILDISKVEAGHLEVESRATDMQTLLADLYSILKIKAGEKGLGFNVQLSTPIPRVIHTDPMRLRQILINLTANAIKFTENGSVEIHASCTEKENHESYLRFQIRDTGVGIPTGQAERLFQPFTQVDSSTTRRFGGTGLGLALSRKFARALGGDVKLLNSRVGSGSVFEIEIATGPVDKTSFMTALAADVTKGAVAKEAPVNLLAGLSVLLVEDAPDNRALIGKFLRLAGARVELAVNGQEGVDKALSENFDLVLMDIQMPVLDGYEATTRLRAQGYHKPIIALTAHALKEERERCLSIGCVDHLTKPINRQTLIESVAKHAVAHPKVASDVSATINLNIKPNISTPLSEVH